MSMHLLECLGIFLYGKTMINSEGFLLFTMEDLIMAYKGWLFLVLGDTMYPGRNMWLDENLWTEIIDLFSRDSIQLPRLLQQLSAVCMIISFSFLDGRYSCFLLNWKVNVSTIWDYPVLWIVSNAFDIWTHRRTSLCAGSERLACKTILVHW